jgi:hypothetical protein
VSERASERESERERERERENLGHLRRRKGIFISLFSQWEGARSTGQTFEKRIALMRTRLLGGAQCFHLFLSLPEANTYTSVCRYVCTLKCRPQIYNISNTPLLIVSRAFVHSWGYSLLFARLPLLLSLSLSLSLISSFPFYLYLYLFLQALFFAYVCPEYYKYI